MRERRIDWGKVGAIGNWVLIALNLTGLVLNVVWHINQR